MKLLNLNSPSLCIKSKRVPWDESALNGKVVEFNHLKVFDISDATLQLSEIIKMYADEGVALISCRLKMNELLNSMALENCGFKFIETILHPFFEIKDNFQLYPESPIKIQLAKDSDLLALSKIAENAFEHERFHVDPRLSIEIGNLRYKNWILSVKNFPNQTLYKVVHENKAAGFFLFEQNKRKNSVFWHLTAIDRSLHGIGIGSLSWQSMINKHKSDGFKLITTSISSRNSKVLGLYSKLNFRFKDPEMTFHWVNEAFIND